jgi:tripartite-type tricarboxylate transporter receptor subunit TctC
LKLAHRRQFLHLAAGAAGLPFAPHVARAQGYPSRPVRMLIGYPPGGTVDIHARLVAQWLSERLGQPFIVENRAGAGGSLATDAAVRAAPDGYTLLYASAADSWNAALYTNLKFNFVGDVAPVASFQRGAGVLVANPAVPVKSVPALIAYAKANPGKVTVASSGVGSAPHIYWELFRTMTGVEMLHVPYRGAGPALADLMGGQVQIMFSTLAASIEYVRTRKLLALGVTTLDRSEELPNIPTLSQFVPGYEAVGWQGLVAPKNTPAEFIDRLNGEINAALADTKMRARLAGLGSTPFASSPSDFGKFIAEFTDKWGKVIRAANIKAE